MIEAAKARFEQTDNRAHVEVVDDAGVLLLLVVFVAICENFQRICLRSDIISRCAEADFIQDPNGRLKRIETTFVCLASYRNDLLTIGFNFFGMDRRKHLFVDYEWQNH